MKAPVDAYVAQLKNGPNTKGVGNQKLAPKVLPDGTKEFDLKASIIDWEVSPGKTVKAWAYNGQVPGPWIKVNVGDKVRVVLDNELPQSTVIHFHGIEVPNAMDGVPDVTQPPVKPGQKFTYEFVAKTPAMGMYHSHDYAEHQVPDGLFGVFQIGDVPVPAGTGPVTQQVPMVLNDAGVIGLSLNGKSFPATAPVIAKVGEWVEITYFNEGLADPPDAPARAPATGDRQGRVPAAAAVPGRHDRGRARVSATPCSCTPRPTSSAPTGSPGCGRSTATSSRTPKATTGCSAWSRRSSSSPGRWAQEGGT